MGTRSLLADFLHYYRKSRAAMSQYNFTTPVALPKVRLIGLNSNFDEQATGRSSFRDNTQLEWFGDVLAKAQDEFHLAMVHHNVVNTLPHQRAS